MTDVPPEKKILEIHLRAGAPKPAVGERGGPAEWRRQGEDVAGARPDFEDARWSFLYGEDTSYARRPEPIGPVPLGSGLPESIQGPMLNAPVWTWEVPAYFWFGGMASGSAFVALAADLAGDEPSARIARRVALGAAVPCAPLLIMDLGRPERFLHMLRIFKPRSPMSMGAWCLLAFSNTAAGAVGADLLGRRRAARALGAATAVLGTYLGSYTGALLASTAVPVWGRSRLYLGPIFVCTAMGTGAAATRLALPRSATATRRALDQVQTVAMTAELVITRLNERRLGSLGTALHEGSPGRRFRLAKWATLAGLALRVLRRPGSEPLYLAAGLAVRFAWIEAGKVSARDDEAVARTARERA